MKVIVGLGNPGIKYINNRHNAGRTVIDELKNFKTKDKILKSDCFMNDSGSFVLSQYTKYHIPYTNLYVIHDDLDIPLGSFKIQFGKGPKDHNGLISIYEALGTREFWHVRVGVDNRQEALGTRIKGEQYVLQDFTEEEKTLLGKVIKQICNQLAKL